MTVKTNAGSTEAALAEAAPNSLLELIKLGPNNAKALKSSLEEQIKRILAFLKELSEEIAAWLNEQQKKGAKPEAPNLIAVIIYLLTKTGPMSSSDRDILQHLLKTYPGLDRLLPMYFPEPGLEYLQDIRPKLDYQYQPGWQPWQNRKNSNTQQNGGAQSQQAPGFGASDQSNQSSQQNEDSWQQNSGSTNTNNSAATLPDYYETLGLKFGASDAEIKSAFRKKCLANHPDKFPPGEQRDKANEKVKEVIAAGEVLRDPDKKKEYDEQYKRQHADKVNAAKRDNTDSSSKKSAAPRSEQKANDEGARAGMSLKRR